MHPIIKSAVLGSKGDIFGVRWDKRDSPLLTRTGASRGMVAAAGIGMNLVKNDFDHAPILGEIITEVDTLGNYFQRIPKFYIRKEDVAGYKTIEFCKTQRPGFYLPWCFWDFTNNRELSYYDHGKYKASKDGSSKLCSVPNVFPLINDNIVNFRTFAQNNNTGGLLGYQQLDIHVVDVLRTLMLVEFANLNIQTVMQGYTTGNYVATHVATVAESGVNRIIIANAFADTYRVGQPISVGTTVGAQNVMTNRTITSIGVYDASNKFIIFDGAPVNVAVGNIVYNSVWKNGFSSGIAASSGSLVANDGKSPCVYRGIESPFGDMWQFVDGVNINEYQAWVCKNAAQYASNVFASPYEQLSYVNHNANGYVAEMGFDINNPFAEFAKSITGADAAKYYADYYYQATGQRIALFGGHWSYGTFAGLSYWDLANSSSSAYPNVGGRLVRKAL